MQKLNNIDENIEFTMEKASEGNLAVLDYIITLNEKREIITKVYRKPTHTVQYTHFSLKALVRRAKFVCNN